MEKCGDLNGSVVKTVVVGIRLAESTLKNSDDIIAKALESDKVLEALHKEFNGQASALLKSSLMQQPLGPKEAKQFVEKVAKAAKPEVISGVKAQQEFLLAKNALKRLKCAFDETPTGVFVNENKTWLIIVGVVAAVGGAVALYKIRKGDVPAKGMAYITNLAASNIEIGSVSLGLKGVEFKPSERKVAATASVKIGDLKSVNTSLEISTTVKNDKLETLSANNTLVIPLAPKLTLNSILAGGYKDKKPFMDFALALKYNPKGFDLDLKAYSNNQFNHQYKLGAGVAAKYKFNVPYMGNGAYGTLGPSFSAGSIFTPNKAAQFEVLGGLNFTLRM